MINILGQLETGRFLSDYWQSKPLLIRQAIKDFEPDLDADTLAGLALEESVRSRIVQQTGPSLRWKCRFGPFTEEDFSRLPDTHWTLLVQDVEKHLPDHASILEHFSFLPRWRIEDLMVSYAVDGGSVGPHTDQYDVFLLQAAGRRQWSLQLDDIEEGNLVEDSDLRILKDFTADEEWILNPGDMLYLPPGVAHYGVALGECMTWSIGFRAPSQTDLLLSYADQFSMDEQHPEFYRDRIDAAFRRSELRSEDITRMRELILNSIDDELLTRSLGSLLTVPVETLSLYDSEIDDVRSFTKQLLASSSVHLHPAARCVYIRQPDGIILYVNTLEHNVSQPGAASVMELCDNYQLHQEAIKPILSDDALISLLHELQQQGYLHIEHQDNNTRLE